MIQNGWLSGCWTMLDLLPQKSCYFHPIPPISTSQRSMAPAPVLQPRAVAFDTPRSPPNVYRSVPTEKRHGRSPRDAMRSWSLRDILPIFQEKLLQLWQLWSIIPRKVPAKTLISCFIFRTLHSKKVTSLTNSIIISPMHSLVTITILPSKICPQDHHFLEDSSLQTSSNPLF